MKFLMIVALAAALPLQATTASATDAKSAAVAGQKIDSGLGELPHYRLWADPSGKNPVTRPVAADAQRSAEPKAQHNAGAKALAPQSTEVATLK
jgi:uncharacterized protein YijF (DUF1287 family)